MNQPPSMPPGTRHLVAPQLLPALDAFPSFDINLETIAELRAGGIRRDGMMPPLSPAQQAVHCEQRFVPGPTAAPDVRVLIYRPQGPEANARPTGSAAMVRRRCRCIIVCAATPWRAHFSNEGQGSWQID
jgi:hypothetical protein